MTYIITCYPYFDGKGYLTQFTKEAEKKQEIIDFCNRNNIYYKTIINYFQYLTLSITQKGLHNL